MAGSVAVLAKKGPREKTKLLKGALLNPLKDNRSEEQVFAVVGYAGSGTSKVVTMLAAILKKKNFEPHVIKARPILQGAAQRLGVAPLKEGATPIGIITYLQSVGDALRDASGECGVVAAYMVKDIKRLRDANPDKKNIYLLDSLKHPDEVALLRHVYGPNFFLVGVGCRPDKRRKRLQVKFRVEDGDVGGLHEIDDFINRDAEDSEHKHGQQVNKTFHLADYFVDNTGNVEVKAEYFLPDQLKRLEDIVFRNDFHRPTADERGMYYAQSAAMRSACLSRQVGASILDRSDTLIAVGANEVPKKGGGAYDSSCDNDDRCYKTRKECANTKQQNKILGDVYDRLRSAGLLSTQASIDSVTEALKVTRVKSLIEFSRAVHAEMDALMSLVRSGTKLEENATLFSTTYPCHNCARHIVAAGIGRVVYLEPYAKSLAIELHDDSIADNLPPDEVGSRVRFDPYQGVSPRLYESVFTKRSDLKSESGDFIYSRDAHIRSVERPLWTKTYIQFEQEVEGFVAKLLEPQDDEGQ